MGKMGRAKTECLDEKTELLVSFLDGKGKVNAPVKGSYAALNWPYRPISHENS